MRCIQTKYIKVLGAGRTKISHMQQRVAQAMQLI